VAVKTSWTATFWCRS